MEQRVKVDLIFIACWILGYLLATWYLLRVGIEIGTIALVFSILVPIILEVRSMILSQIKGYPILKPVLTNLTKGRYYWLNLENESTARAKGAEVAWCYSNITSPEVVVEPEYGGMAIAPRKLRGDFPWRLPKEFPLPYDKKGESVIVRIKTSNVDGKKDFCACRVFVSDGENWKSDGKGDRNTKPYINKFKPCKDCMFQENEHGTT